MSSSVILLMSILTEYWFAEKRFRAFASMHPVLNDDPAVRHGGLAHLPCLIYPQKSNEIKGHYTADLSVLVSVDAYLYDCRRGNTLFENTILCVKPHRRCSDIWSCGSSPPLPLYFFTFHFAILRAGLTRRYGKRNTVGIIIPPRGGETDWRNI